MTEPGEMKRDFYLIETILWQAQADSCYGPAGYPLFVRHFERLKKSAVFFSFSFPEKAIKEVMQALSAKLAAGELKGLGRELRRFKVRCTLDSSGTFAVAGVDELVEIAAPVKLDISPETVDPGDIFLYHKTSRRELFDRERKRLKRKDCFDTVFLNKRGEVTQGTITNIFLDSGAGVLLTPALGCGLLPGVLRHKLLAEGGAQEAVLKKEDLIKAEALYVGNSVRGLLRAELTDR